VSRVWDSVLDRLGDIAPATRALSEWGRARAALLVVRPGSGRVIVGPSTARTVIGPAPRTVVATVKRAVWGEKGWTVSTEGRRTTYTGSYEVLHWGARRAFEGRVVMRGADIEAYIADPPEEIREHPKGPCFQLTRAPWFRVHWHRAPKDVDSAILYVEKVLSESLNQ
jgi:hypothetical protein